VHFSTAFQSDSKFRYLGDQKIGRRDTYVVFAQQPGKSGIAVTMKGSRGTAVRMLTQGLVWGGQEKFPYPSHANGPASQAAGDWIGRADDKSEFQ
jgi:hypothetical protein